MHLLAQTIIDPKNGANAPQKIIDYVDKEVLSNIDKWTKELINSQYISVRILDALELDNPTTKMQAIKILPFLNLGHDDILALSGRLINEVDKGANPEMIEHALHGLGHLSGRQEIYESLLRFSENPRSIISLVAMEVLFSKVNDRNIPELLGKLDSPSIPIITSVLDSLIHFKNSKYIDDIKNKLLGKLSYP